MLERLRAVWNVIAEAAGFWMEHLIFINILSVVIVFFDRRDPKTVWTWLLVLYFIPILGIFLYFMVGMIFTSSICSGQGDRGRHVFRHQRTGGDDYP